MDPKNVQDWTVLVSEPVPEELLGGRRHRELAPGWGYVVYCRQKEDAEDFHDLLVLRGFKDVQVSYTIDVAGSMPRHPGEY